jgi:large subunit ribosomal protein L4
MQLTKITKTGTKSQVDVNAALFGAPVNQQLLAQAVRVYMSNLRQGTSKTQTRSDVNRTAAKWYKQKGTGKARHGARNAPLFVGGGVAHGPNGTQNWNRSLPKTMKVQALISALSAQAQNVVISDAIQDMGGKTKEAVEMLKNLTNGTEKVLVILAELTPNVVRSLNNLETVLLTRASRVNALELATADRIVINSDAIKILEERAGLGAEKPVAVKKEASKKETIKKEAAPVKKAAPKKETVKKPSTKKAVVSKK